MFVTSFEHGSNTFGDYMKARESQQRHECRVQFQTHSNRRHLTLYKCQSLSSRHNRLWSGDAEDEGYGLARVPKVSGNEIYAGPGADYLAWGKKCAASSGGVDDERWRLA
ncbi:hypothetical protein KXD40_004302 [Peronospora effusa]|nr:hypothetical protein KXD40_004302 [Peronospora effusa]